MGFAHEPHPKFQTTSFSRHFCEQGPRYNVYRRGKGRLKTGGAILPKPPPSFLSL
ncbi:hypothetical protein NEISICOT_01042 [Neisseria sicca ATCC 29256]|uniref:Uncharacterized protein n=1 Tax=Neisseria sicca ATCC 29256 TaxID=547045 RepID=C6M3R2_NEISI|nr:hypothetical protein NEISICOT_01042 [Neisseria sicca ATCC 29256]